jgi:hypothetical protein
MLRPWRERMHQIEGFRGWRVTEVQPRTKWADSAWIGAIGMLINQCRAIFDMNVLQDDPRGGSINLLTQSQASIPPE